MKRLFVFFTVFMFFANTFAVSAWAKPCVNMNGNAASSSVSVANSDMPCHKQEQKKTPAKHCKGMCLCLHVSMSQTPIIVDAIHLSIPVMESDKLLSQDEQISVWSTSPPRRPPKTIS